MNTTRKILLTILLFVILFGGGGILLVNYIFPKYFPNYNNNTIEKSSIDEITFGVIKRAEQPLDMNVIHFLNYNDSLINNYDIKNVRNPFSLKKLAPKKSSSSNTRVRRTYRPRINVNGIISDASKPYAILNGEVYVVGDIIKGYTVQSIQDSIVVLHSKTDLFTVKYKKD